LKNFEKKVIDLNVTNEVGLNPLEYAVATCRPLIAHFFLKQGLRSGEKGFSAFAIAANKECFSGAKYLLDNGLLLDRTDFDPAIKFILENSSKKTIEFVVNNIPICSKSGHKSLARHLAEAKRQKIVAPYIKRHAKSIINCEDSQGVLPLANSALENRQETFQLLLKLGASANHLVGENNLSLLHHYSGEPKGNLDIIKILIKYGANVNAITNSGDSPLTIASRHNRIDVIKILIESRANINFKGIKGQTALIYASGLGYVDIVKYLLKKGADLEVTENQNITALFYAAANNQKETLKELLQAGANVNHISANEETAVTMSSDLSIRNILFSYGAKSPEINIKQNSSPSYRENCSHFVSFSFDGPGFEHSASIQLNGPQNVYIEGNGTSNINAATHSKRDCVGGNYTFVYSNNTSLVGGISDERSFSGSFSIPSSASHCSVDIIDSFTVGVNVSCF